MCARLKGLNMLRLLSFLGLSLIIAGCATAPQAETKTQATETRTDVAALNVTAASKGGLGPQTLAPGECGLFLWSKSDLSKFVFFSKAASGTSVMARGEDTLSLTQTGAGGDLFGQFNTLATYEEPSGITVEMSIIPGEALEGGQRLQSGLLTVSDTEGWRTKYPVLGLRACQPD